MRLAAQYFWSRLDLLSAHRGLASREPPRLLLVRPYLHIVRSGHVTTLLSALVGLDVALIGSVLEVRNGHINHHPALWAWMPLLSGPFLKNREGEASGLIWLPAVEI